MNFFILHIHKHIVHWPHYGVNYCALKSKMMNFREGTVLWAIALCVASSCCRFSKWVLYKKTQWHSIGYKVIGKTYDGWEKKISKVMYNNTKPLELIEYFKPHLSNFIVHNLITYWQEKKIKYYLKHILDDIVVSYMEFSKN